MALKGIEYDYKPINLLKDELSTPEFASVNPIKYVPALKLDENTVLIESLPIIEYIDQVYTNGPPIIPKDPLKAAKARAIASVITSSIQPFQNVGIFTKLKQMGIDEKEWAKSWIQNKFVDLEKLLEPTCGSCCVGDDITIADLCLMPQVYNAKRFRVDVDQFKNITKIVNHLQNHQAFVVSHPDRQPDCPQQ